MNKQGPRRFPRRTRPLHLWEAGKPGETRETHTPRGETLQDSRCSTSISHLFLPLFPLLLGSTASEGFLHSLASFGPSPPLFLCSLRPLLPSSFLGLFSIWETKIFPGPQAVCTAGGGGCCSTFSQVGRTPSGAGPAAVSPLWTFGAAEKLGLLGMALQFR